MKDRFLISRYLICSRRYLMLSPSAQSLYIALNADADDDGIVDAYAVMLRQRAAENDLKQLIESNFVVLLDSTNLLVWLCDWLAQNVNRDLRYVKASQYRPLLAKVIPSAQVMMLHQDTNGKKSKQIVPVSIAMQSATNQDELSIREIPRHKSNRSQDKFNTCLDYSTYNCPYCDGTGKCGNEICSHCLGTGVLKIKSERNGKNGQKILQRR